MDTAVKSHIDDFLHGLDKLAHEYLDTHAILCATYVSPGVGTDAGGFMIVGGHLIKVPGWQPDGMEFTKSKVAVAAAAFAITSLMPAGVERDEAERLVAKSLNT